MVYGFVKQSNGHITVQSEPDVGTTFRIYLLAEPVPEKARKNFDALEIGQRVTSEVILVIEDDPGVQSMVHRALNKFGYKVHVANDGREGLALLSEQPDIDLLLTYILLPGQLNGRQVAEQALQAYPNLKVIFMSGYARDAIVEQGRLAAGVRLLSKPFNPSVLGEWVREILDE